MSSRSAVSNTGLDELAQWVADEGARPVDAMHVAVLLEMGGWTDSRASRLGYEDVFSLAEAVFDRLRTQYTLDAAVPVVQVNWLQRGLRLVGLYLRGLIFALPMLLSSSSVLLLKYSVWSYVGFSTEVATGIALGTFASFLVAGGFTQAMARRGLFYLSQNLYSLARRACMQLLVVGTVVTLVIGLVGTVVMALVPILPRSILQVAGLYYLMLTFIWLGIGLLYMLQRVTIVVVTLLGGIGIVYLLVTYLHVRMMTAQVVGMSFIAIFTMLAGLLFMFRLEQKDEMDDAKKALMPRWSQISRSLAPYFLYGILYFALVFMDRLMSWSVPGEFHPYVIWFLGDYELGLDWALWTLVLPMGLVEVYIHVMFDRIADRKPLTTIRDLDTFNQQFRRDHSRMSLFIVGGGVVSLALVILLIGWLGDSSLLPVDPLASSVTRFVFFLAAPSFIAITVGLQSALVLFSLNVPWPIVRASGSALAGNLLVGFFASRYGGHQWAALGLLTGAGLFAFIAYREAQRVLGQLDFHLMRSV